MKNLHILDEMDLEFIMGIHDCLKVYYKDNAMDVLLKSSFLRRLKEDTEYVYHYDEQYWAEVIKNEFDSKQTVTV